MRGEFIRGDGLVIPNQITTFGVKSIFQWALQNSGYNLYMGMADCNPVPLLDAADTNEPTIGIAGYERQAIPRSTGWPTSGEVNGETYFQTAAVVFPATDAWDGVVSRLMLINHAVTTNGKIVVALSTPFGIDVQIDAATPVLQRTFKYRVYGR